MKTKGIHYSRVIAFTGLLSLLLIYILLWRSMISDPALRSGSDFSGLYTYARIFQTRGIAYINDPQEQQRVQSEIVGRQVHPILYTHLPMNAPLASLLVDEDYVGSFQRWAMVLLVVNALNTWLLMRLVNVRAFQWEHIVVLSAGAFLFFPTFSGFLNGREEVFLLLGLILWVCGLSSKRDFLAGLGLSLACIRPQLALMLAIPFLFRQRRVFYGFALGGAVLAGANLALVGMDGAVKYMESVRYIENTVWYEAHALDMPTLSGIIRRNFILENPAPARAFVWASYGLGIAAFSWLWHRSAVIEEPQLGLVSIGAVFLAPYAHYHDLILLLIPLFCLIRIFLKLEFAKGYPLAMGPLVVSLLTMLGFVGSETLKFPLAYGLMILLAGLSAGSDRIIHGRSVRAPAGEL